MKCNNIPDATHPRSLIHIGSEEPEMERAITDHSTNSGVIAQERERMRAADVNTLAKAEQTHD